MRWSAVAIPLRPGSVDAVVTDLPFGHKCLTSAQIKRLYPAIVRQAAKLLPMDGVLLALTSLNGPRLLSESLTAGPWRVAPGHTDAYPVNVGGMESELLLAQRTNAGDVGQYPPPPLTKKQRRRAALEAKAKAAAAVAGLA